jgi:hypothetical protein
MFVHIHRALLLAPLIVAGMTGGSHAASLKTTCGALVQNIVITQNSKFETTSTTFVRVPKAALFVTVPAPASTTRCIKVRFTVGATCIGVSGSERCFIRALANGAEMNPTANGNQLLAGRQFFAAGNAYQWISRLGVGAHEIEIQIRRDASESTTVAVDNWAMDIEILK